MVHYPTVSLLATRFEKSSHWGTVQASLGFAHNSGGKFQVSEQPSHQVDLPQLKKPFSLLTQKSISSLNNPHTHHTTPGTGY